MAIDDYLEQSLAKLFLSATKKVHLLKARSCQYQLSNHSLSNDRSIRLIVIFLVGFISTFQSDVNDCIVYFKQTCVDCDNHEEFVSESFQWSQALSQLKIFPEESQIFFWGGGGGGSLSSFIFLNRRSVNHRNRMRCDTASALFQAFELPIPVSSPAWSS